MILRNEETDFHHLNNFIGSLGLNSKSRKKVLVYSRQILSKHLRPYMSLQGIAKLLNQDHATVLHGIRQYDINIRYEDYKALENDMIEYHNILNIIEFTFKHSIIHAPVDTHNIKEVHSLVNLENQIINVLKK